MNIIKLQNMLRGAPDDALINYVQNPQGEVPSYLVLSELQRRKDTRAKYQAEQAPESSVAEDLTQPAQPQGGLGMLADQPQMQDDDQGVAGLPVPDDMYQDQNYASGGIVAFDDGGGVKYDDGSVGYPFGGYVVPALMATGRVAAKYGGRGLKYLKDKAIGTSKVTAPAMNLPTGSVTPVLEQGTKGFLQKPGFYVDTAVVGGTIYGINQYGEKEKISAEEARKVALDKERAAKELADKEAAAKRAAETPKNVAPAEEKIKSIGDYAKELQDYVGTDPNAAAQRERLLKMEERAARREEMAPYMALTEAGFKTMQGTSPFALTNIGAGAQAGLQSYATAQDKIADLEEKRNALALGLDQAQRSERIAFAQFGATSKQAEETRRATKQIADQKLMVDLLIADNKNQTALEVAGTLKPSEQGKIANEVISDPKFVEWQAKWFEKNGEKYDEESPEFQIAYNNELARRVGLRSGQNVNPTNYGGFKVIK
jgi:hypothetical protein